MSDVILKNNTNLQLFNSIEKAYNKAHTNPSAAERYSKDAMDWYRDYIPKNYNKVRTSQLFRSQELWSNQIKFGVPCFFDYDALHKDSLPVWDAFPFTIFFEDEIQITNNSISSSVDFEIIIESSFKPTNGYIKIFSMDYNEFK